MLSSYRSRLSLVLFFCNASCALAQQPPTPPPHQRPIPPPLPPADQQQEIAYWTTETGWNSELQLRNNALSQDLTVTPVLRLADGAETILASVTVKAQEVTSIDIGAAISAAAAPNLVGTYGSLVLRYRSPSERVLYAAMMVRRVGCPIAFHIDAMGESADFQAGSREGIWWLPKDSTSDYLILTNQGSHPIPLVLSLYNSVGKENKQRLILGALETRRFSVRKLAQAAGLTGSYGGIKVAATAHAGSLDTLHFLFDETAGFSAILKMFDYDPATPLQERDYAHTGIWTQRAPMLALSNPDTALAFPTGTTLHPQIFIRNTAGKPADVSLRFNWRTASTTGPAAGPGLHLNPYETRVVDVAALQGAGTLPKEANWTSVTLTTTGLPDEIVAVAASHDPSLRYGAQTPFSDQLTFRWEGGMWEYDPYHNSIITAGNGGTKPTRAAFTIFYNQGTQRYDLEQTLQPDEQMWIDVGKLIREHVPDKNGTPLPPDLASGSYEFRDLTNTGVGTLFEGKVIYDKTYGHVVYGCATCCGYAQAKLFVNPIGVPLGNAASDGVNGYNNCPIAWEDVSDSFYNKWASANTSVATVDYYGTHTGVSAASTTSNTSGYLNGVKHSPSCPVNFFNPGGGVNVVPGFTVGYNSFIAVDHIVGPRTCTFAGQPAGMLYEGDAYRGTYRTAEQIHVIPDLLSSSGFFPDTGYSKNYGKGSPVNGTTLSDLAPPKGDYDGLPYDCYLWNQTGKATPNFFHDETYPLAHQAQVHYVGASANPLEDQNATITWDMRTVIDTSNKLAPTAYVNYNHTCYPAHQVKVDGAVIYYYEPPDNSPSYLVTCLVLHDFKRVGVTSAVVVH